MPRAPRYKIFLLFCIFSFFLFIVSAYFLGSHIIFLNYLGVEAIIPIFLDTRGILSLAECTRLGFDVYFENPCDPFGRISNNSPIWLLPAVFPITTEYATIVGSALGVCFIGVVVTIFRPWNYAQALYCLAAVVSPSVVFAIERANIDLVVFLIASASIWIYGRKRWTKYISYVGIFIAALMKFYPAVGFIIAADEKWRKFLIISLISTAAYMLFVVLMFDELLKGFRQLPTPASRDSFGSAEIIDWVIATSQYVFGTTLHTGQSWAPAGRWGLIAAAVAVSVLVWRALERRGVRLNATATERNFFLVGGSIVVFCFFSTVNISYRCVFFLLLIPAVLRTLSESRNDSATVRFSWVFLGIILLVLWSNFFHFRVDPVFDQGRGVVPWLVVWLLDEVICWTAIILVMALIWQQLARSQLARSVVGPGLERSLHAVLELVEGPNPRHRVLRYSWQVGAIFLGTALIVYFLGAGSGPVDPGVSRIDFDRDDPAVAYGSGWGDFEVDEDGVSWRWVVGRTAELYLGLPEGRDSVLIFRAMTHDGNRNQTITVHVNGRSIGRKDVHVSERLIGMRVRVPATAVDRAVSTVRFSFAEAERPSGGGSRPLSMMFESLEVN